MRVISRFLPVVLMSILVLLVTAPANAQYVNMKDVKFPKVDTPEWKSGQSATYVFKVGGVPDVKGDLSAKMRIACVGTEAVEGQNFHWIEIDLSDLIGVPAEAGLPFKMLKIKLLTKFMDPEKYQSDPKAFLTEIANGKVLRKLIFQMDEQPPQMIDFMTIQGMVQGMTGQDLATMVKDLPIDQVKEDPKVKFESNTGKETVTVQAGTFTDAPFMWFKGSDEASSGEGKIHAHSKVPIVGLVKMAMDITDNKDNIKMSMELANYEMSGAQSLIKGEPVPFDMMSFFGGMAEPSGAK